MPKCKTCGVGSGEVIGQCHPCVFGRSPLSALELIAELMADCNTDTMAEWNDIILLRRITAVISSVKTAKGTRIN